MPVHQAGARAGHRQSPVASHQSPAASRLGGLAEGGEEKTARCHAGRPLRPAFNGYLHRTHNPRRSMPWFAVARRRRARARVFASRARTVLDSPAYSRFYVSASCSTRVHAGMREGCGRASSATRARPRRPRGIARRLAYDVRVQKSSTRARFAGLALFAHERGPTAVPPPNHRVPAD